MNDKNANGKQQKRRYVYQRNVCINDKYPSNRLFRNEIQSLLRRANARGNVDIIYRACDA